MAIRGELYCLFLFIHINLTYYSSLCAYGTFIPNLARNPENRISSFWCVTVKI